MKEQLINAYLDFAEKHKSLPSVADIQSYGFIRNNIRYYFGNMTQFRDYMYEHHKDELLKHVLLAQDVFKENAMLDLQNRRPENERYVITTVVAGKKVNQNFFDAIKTYCRAKNATLLLIPCSSSVSTQSRPSLSGTEWVFDSILKDEIFVYVDIHLNDNLILSSLKLNDTLVDPALGLQRLTQDYESLIVASPKQRLKFTINAERKDKKYPTAIMSPGAITLPDYNSSPFLKKKREFIADSDHVMGGLVVEIEDHKTFHFRQIQADPFTGAFVDLGTMYYPNGLTETVSASLVLGDYHCGQTDPYIKNVFIPEIVDIVKLDNVVIHDFFDGYSISHHDINQELKRAKKASEDKLSLQNELNDCGKELISLLRKDLYRYTNIVMVCGNHDEFLDRYLEQARYASDPQNHRLALDLAKAYLDGKNPLRYALENHTDYEHHLSNRVIWLDRKSEFRYGDVELGQHGDLGINGSRGSMNSAEIAYRDCVIGHSHTAGIQRGVYQVGTSTVLDMGYNRGPSTWTQTHCLVYTTGHRQLINIINGSWRLKDDKAKDTQGLQESQSYGGFFENDIFIPATRGRE